MRLELLWRRHESSFRTRTLPRHAAIGIAGSAGSDWNRWQRLESLAVSIHAAHMFFSNHAYRIESADHNQHALGLRSLPTVAVQLLLYHAIHQDPRSP